MNDLLKKLKLIQTLTTRVEMQQQDFVAKLREHVDEGSLGIFSDTFDVFSTTDNEFKGHVGPQDFKIKRRKKLFSGNANFAIAKGTFKQEYETLIIHTEINGFRKLFIPFFIFALIIYPTLVVTFLSSDTDNGSGLAFALPFILIHGAFMFGLPYFIMRRSVKKMKYDLEREFHYMTKR